LRRASNARGGAQGPRSGNIAPRTFNVSNNNEYQRTLAKSLIDEEDCIRAYELAKQYGWEGVMDQIRFMSRVGEFN
jgi:hypothetical protein